MTHELYNLYRYNFTFYNKYRFLFENKAPAVVNIKDYFDMCGYDPSKEPFVIGASNFGLFHPDMLLKYKEQFLYHIPDNSKFGYTFVFNFNNDSHLWAYCYNYPDQDREKPRFVIMPAFYAVDQNKTVDFYNDNAEFLVKPTVKEKFGFANAIEPPEYIPVI